MKLFSAHCEGCACFPPGFPRFKFDKYYWKNTDTALHISSLQLVQKEIVLLKPKQKIKMTDSIIKINAGGRIFQTQISTLTKYPESMLAVMFTHTDEGKLIRYIHIKWKCVWL